MSKKECQKKKKKKIEKKLEKFFKELNYENNNYLDIHLQMLIV